MNIVKLLNQLNDNSVGCKASNFTCNTDGYGESEQIFYTTTSRLDAKIKARQLDRHTHYPVRIYYAEWEYFVAFPCEIVNAKWFNIPILKARHTYDLIRASEHGYIFTFELIE
jgi:hypothetical protein